MANTISASFNYLDIGIVVFLCLFLAIGVIRGFSKSLHGIFLSFAIVLFSVLLVGLLFEPVRGLSFVSSLDDILIQKSTEWGPAFNSQIYIVDKSYLALVEGSLVPLGEIGGFAGFVANLIAKLFITQDGQMLGSILATSITNIIVSLCLFAVLCVVLWVIIFIIRHFTENLHFSQNGAVKIIDRIGGGIISLGLGLIFVFVVLAIFSFLQNVSGELANQINNSIVGNFLSGINPLYSIFDNLLGASII